MAGAGGLLEPDENRLNPTFDEQREMPRRIRLSRITLPEPPFDELLGELNKRYDNGGAQIAAFGVGDDSALDWFASRNRLDEVLDWLILHPVILGALPELKISTTWKNTNGFESYDPFFIDGLLARMLYYGGAYWAERGNGQQEKILAGAACDAMFGSRYGEIACAVSETAWTPWFQDVAWDLTQLIFDRRERKLWLLAVTDTD